MINPNVRIAGTIYWQNIPERVVGAVVTARVDNGEINYAVTDDDGDFSFNNLPQGTYTIAAFHEDGQAYVLRNQQIQQDKTDLTIRLFRSMGDQDTKLGLWFFVVVCVMLLLLIGFYIFSHARFSPPGEPLNPALITRISQASMQVSQTKTLSTSTELASTLTEIRSDLNRILTDNPQTLTASDIQLVAELIVGAENFIKQNDKNGALDQLARLRSTIEAPQSRDFFWNREPWRFTEVLLWGLAGVLVNLIITSATYLRWGRFYKEGLFFHISQVITVPILALVIVFLLSLVTLKVTLSGSEVQLDLTDARILAAVSFIIGSNPWAMVGFLRGVSQSIIGARR